MMSLWRWSWVPSGGRSVIQAAARLESHRCCRRTPDTGLRVTRPGHSTTLIEIDGDAGADPPGVGVASPFSLIRRPKRFQPVPAARPASPVDVAIIRHDHYDHLNASNDSRAGEERRALRDLARGREPTPGIAPARITELDWWERAGVTNRWRAGGSCPSIFRGARPSTRNATVLVVVRRWCLEGSIAFSSAATEAHDAVPADSRSTRHAETRRTRSPGRVSFGAVEPWWRSVDRVVVAELPVASESTESTLTQTRALANRLVAQVVN